MRFLLIFTIALLSSCSNEQAVIKNSTQVSVNFGSSLASGALLPSGQVPTNIATIALQALSASGTPLASPITMQKPNFNATFTVPNGNNIRIRARAYDTNSNLIYQGISAAYSLTGNPITISITLSLNVSIQASANTSPRGGSVNLTGLIAGIAPTASSPLLWQTNGGTIVSIAGANGGQVTWTAPSVLGSYTIRAQVDPTKNPDQNPNAFASITLEVVNQAPTATSANITTSEDTVSAPTIPTVIDPDPADTHTFAIVNQGTKGTATVINNQLIYTPSPNTNGTDTFTFKAIDNAGASITGTANVTITPVNDAPIFIGTPNIVQTSPVIGTTLTLANVSATDIDGDTLTLSYQWMRAGVPIAGATTASYLLITADAGQAMTCQITANDGAGSANSTTSIVTNPVSTNNTPPVATNDAVTTNEDTPVTTINVLLNDTDADGNVLSISSADTLSASGGSIINHGNGTFTYTPTLNFNGADTFQYIVTDGIATATGTVTITVNPINDVPVITLQGNPIIDIYTGTTYVDAGATAFDVEDGNVTASITTTNPVNTAIAGIYTITYDVQDSNFAAAIQVSRTVNVISQNLPPIISSPVDPYTWNVLEDTYTQLQIIAISSSPITFDIYTLPNNGVANVDLYSGLLAYTPNTNSNLADSLIARVSDPYGVASLLNINITITPVNDAPVITNNLGLGLLEDAGVSPILTTDLYTSDVDNLASEITYTLTSFPNPALVFLTRNGVALSTGSTFTQADIDGGLVAFTPAANQNGATSFSFTVKDLAALPSPNTIFNINVTPVNDAPVIAVNNTLTVGQGSVTTLDAATLLATDIDNLASALTYTVTTAPLNGSLSLSGIATTIFTQADINNGLLSYTPNAGFIGTDSFGFNLSDGLATVAGTANINVTAPVLSLNISSSLPSGTLVGNSVNIQANLTDLYTGVPTAGTTVNFATTGLAALSSPTAVTDVYGVATVSLSDVYAETVSVTASTTAPALSATFNQTFSNNSGLNTTVSTLPCNAVWDLYGSPYLVTTILSVTSGCSLQVDPYVVVKFDVFARLNVQAGGTLGIYGAPTAPVVMTTVNDDAYGGAFLGSTGTPTLGSWNGIDYQSGSLGSISNLQMHYPDIALDINNASPNITSFTASEFSTHGLYLHSSANQNTSPNMTGIVLNTSDISNRPIYFIGTAADPTAIVAPIINGTSITTASTTAWFGAIHLSGIGVNPSITNMTINGGGHNLYTTNNASGVFTNNTFNAASAEAINLDNNANGLISIDSTNTITNTPAPYVMSQSFPSADIYASLGAGVIDTYTVHLSGSFTAANSILTSDPLNTGNSAYLVTASITVPNGSRLQIDPYTVMKFSVGRGIAVSIGGTLDIYGTPTTPVIMTTVNDDSVAPILATSTGTPGIGSWSGIQYQAASLGTISDAQVRYANNALEITAASPTITNFTATEFGGIGLYLRTFAANQIANPTVTNIVLTTSDTFNYPIYMTSSTADATQVIAPVINGTSITTASISTSLGAIHLSGIGVNPSISNMTINGGGYNLYATNNASGVFTNNIFNAANAESIYLINNANGVISIDSTNTITNAPAPYAMNQVFPSADIYASIGAGVIDTYSVHLSGNFNAANSILTPDPLGTGSSAYLVAGSIAVNNGF
ncbi:MAG: tandem-95 repeat protein [Ghiorsea sp.]|nr:tandem-95 repeat protein [Ghiorsea sp.]